MASSGFQESVRALGAVDVFIGHSLGGAVGAWSVREDGFWPKLFFGLEANPDMGERGSPLLIRRIQAIDRDLVKNTNPSAGNLFSLVRARHRSLRSCPRQCRCENPRSPE